MKFKIGNGCIQIYNTILHMLHNAIESHQYELLKSQNDYQNYKSNKWHLNLAALASHFWLFDHLITFTGPHKSATYVNNKNIY